MATVDLTGELRSETGKEAAKRLRRARRIPGVVYGGAQGPVPVTVDPLALLALTGAGENVLINLALQGGDAPRQALVILKELQLDPVKGSPLHVDFLEISMEKKVRVEVRVVLTGEATGVKNKGGILEHTLRTLTVECLPMSIPERILVDVSGLDVGDAIHVRELPVSEGARILDDEGRVVASVVAMAAEEEAPAAVEETAGEPEVVGKKEKEEAPEAAEGKSK